MKNRYLVFTDLDGTLLDHNDYSFEAAKEALLILKQESIPLILTTSKTFSEVKKIQENLEIKEPCIVENGGGIYIPSNCILAKALHYKDEWIQVSHSHSYLELRLFFKEMQRHYPIVGFGDMSVDEVMNLTSLSAEESVDSMKRDFTEPFILEDDSLADAIKLKANKEGMDIVKGGRFYHLISKGQDKAKAMKNLKHLYDEYDGCCHYTIALGDSQNDFSMLQEANKGILIPRYDGTFSLNAPTNASRAKFPGPKGWDLAIKEIFHV